MPLFHFRRCVAAALALAMPVANAARAADQDGQLWLNIGVRAPISDRLTGAVEGHLRFVDDAGRASTSQARASVAYELSPAFSAGFGYAHIWYYRDDAPDTEENRIWQDFTWRRRAIGGVSPSLRTRLEQSFPEGGQTGWRLREQLRLTRQLATSGAYLFGSGEAYFNLADTDRVQAGFEQLRLSAGGGFRVQEHARIEAGYLNQYIARKRAADRMNHALSLTLTLDL